MDDLISRQAALDIFDDYNVAVENGQIEAYSRDRKRLCDLPPAQLGTNLAEVGTDAISRRAAIDAVTDELDMIDHVPQWVFDRLEKRLKQLPPAQPEPNYDEWCTDCKEYDHENSCCHRWTKVIRQTRRELQDEFVMTAVDGTLWVTVDDVQKVGRVIVDEDKSKFCRQFYMDAQPAPEPYVGHWIVKHGSDAPPICDKCGYESRTTTKMVVDQNLKMIYSTGIDIKSNFCPHCGAKMEKWSDD